MRIELRKDVRTQYIVLYAEEINAEKRDYRLNMLLENDIRGFASCKRERLDGNVLLYYDIGGATSLASYMRSGSADGEFYRRLLMALAETMEEMGQYLLEPDGLMLSDDTVFIDVEKKSFIFIYYPYNGKSFSESCMNFSESLLKELKNDDREAVELGYSFYKECAKGDMTVGGLRDIAGKAVRTDRTEKASDIRVSSQLKPTEVKAAPIGGLIEEKDRHDYSFLYTESETKRSRGLLGRIMQVREKKRPYGTKKNEEEQKYEKKAEGIIIKGPKESEKLYEEDKTVFLGNVRQKSEIKAWLIPENNPASSMIALEAEKYIVGKRESGADIAFASKAVSRVHSKLIWESGAYGLIDLYSKNGTKLNGEKLREGEKVALKDGDSIVFADVCCIYRQYKV